MTAGEWWTGPTFGCPTYGVCGYRILGHTEDGKHARRGGWSDKDMAGSPFRARDRWTGFSEGPWKSHRTWL